MIILAAALAAIALVMTSEAPGDSQARLDEIAAGAGDASRAAPGAAAAIWMDGRIIWSAATGHAAFAADGVTPARPMTPQTAVRAASISKLATALTALALAEEGAVDLDAPLQPQLGFDLQVPNAERVTLRSALAHTSGLCDPPEYWTPLGAPLADLAGAGLGCEHAPGEDFAYANINYALVAQALEDATGERFDRLAQRHVLEPLALDAGFNWSGVSPERRARGGALHRRVDGVWIVQIDDEASLQDAEPALRRLTGAQLSDYEAGTNGSLFAPQGGLRADVEDLARLAAAFLPGGAGDELTEPVWTGEAYPGVQAWASGPQILLPGQVPGRPQLLLVGHAGEAYGLFGGAWAIPDWNAAVAYFVSGSDPDAMARDPVNGFTVWESLLLELTLDELERRLAERRAVGDTP